MEEITKYEIDEQMEEKEEWKIEDDKAADWWIEVKQQELKEIARLKEQLEEKVNFYKKKLDNLKVEEKYVIENMNKKLSEYFETIDEKNMRKTKTQLQYRLPTGTLIKRLPRQDFVRNDEQLIEFLKKNDLKDYVNIKEAPKWGELKKNIDVVGDTVILKDTGEVVEGVTPTVKPATFEVKI